MVHLSQTSRAACFVALALALGACGTVDDAGLNVESGRADPVTTTMPETTVSGNSSASVQPTVAGEIQDEPLGESGDSLSPNGRVLPASPLELAAELSLAEGAIRDPEVSDDVGKQWGFRQQTLYQVLAQNPAWADAVLSAVEPDLRTAVNLNWRARSELLSLVSSGSASDTLPAWRIVEPRPVDELVGFYEQAGERTGIDWSYLAAINLVETRMGRIEGLSTAGATGPMQFLPTTWDWCCEGDPTDPQDAIEGASTYLALTGAPDDYEKALRAYNNSNYYVVAVSAYAELIRDNPLAYRGFHGWEVFFRSSAGLIQMPIGYEQTTPVDAAQWLLENPQG